ncbi:unnamed protein product [Bursaphelenchus okinawaensis]|uniref:EGF-like domain-containing protein n=1 Tax=Bursaphelenchus okinawaensis TaxID=465554 RepID=A0A811LX29_9BILA|nr:unnamed protein product [Bursaphelenchus okinawaensis]CAG9128645.1 unnamed protein product [Bursaphelenchus okinawaensis]
MIIRPSDIIHGAGCAVRRPNRTFYTMFIIFTLIISQAQVRSLSTAQMVPPSVARATEARHAVSFGDMEHGRIGWRVKRDSLPWKGSYSFLGPVDSNSPTVLLTVADADTGVVIADCTTSIQAKTTPLGWKGELEHDFHWHRVNWELNEEQLTCNTTADHHPIISSLNSDELDAYLVQIKALNGPRCLKNLHTDEEDDIQSLNSNCPPNLTKHSYFAEHLNCGCPIVKRGLPFAENTAFSSIRRKPVSTTEDPTKQPLNDPSDSEEVASPAFPMFHFTQSTEQETEKITETEPFTEVTTPLSTSEETPAPEQSHQVSRETTKIAESAEHEKTTESSAESSATTAASSDPCESFECNNGTCSAESGAPKCTCAEGYAGEHCEQDMCANLGCQNGGTCQVRNGRAVCNCPRGVDGEKCHQLNNLICTPACENGGVCQASMIRTEGNTCKCPHGYTGSNCNLRDLCAKNSTCEQFGPDARCFKDAGDMFRYSSVLTDGVHSCQCPTLRGFIECSQLHPELAKFQGQTETTKPLQSFQSSPPPARPIMPEQKQVNLSAQNILSERTTSPENAHEEVEDTAGHSSTESIQFPRLINQQQSTEEGSAESKPMFGLTSLPNNQPTILPRPTSAKTVSNLQSTMFTRLPDLKHVLYTTTSLPFSPENESEEEGDNGFVPVTQELPEQTSADPAPKISESSKRPTLTIHKLPAQETTKLSVLPSKGTSLPTGTTSSSNEATQASTASTEAKTMTTLIPESAEEEIDNSESSKPVSTEATHGPMGPEHSIVDEIVGTEAPPEFHTVDPSGRPPNPFGPEESENSQQKPAEAEEFEPDSTTTTEQLVTTTTRNDNDSQIFGEPSKTQSNSSTWIIALTVVGILILAATIGSLLMARYVRRSRRLHGKYNPAREENAVTSNYAMPMTSVNKDERLI